VTRIDGHSVVPPVGEVVGKNTAAPEPTKAPEKAPDVFQNPSKTGLSIDSVGPGGSVRLEADLLARAGDVAEVFPAGARDGVRSALSESVRRVRRAEAAGRIEPAETAAALEMMREMMEALSDLKTGKADVEVRTDTGKGVRVWRVSAPDGDVYQVTSRKTQDEAGEARIGVRLRSDDGAVLPGRHRMGMRIDLERWGRTSVDVQFGGSSLDKRIHGLFKNEDGTVFETATGKQLADHHFHGVLPDDLSLPERFSAMVSGFVNGTMAPLESVAQP
jgi:hypothetical protein